ncbi:MAG: invasion associated locus B family protein [Rhodospirillum sp.]|nr:invasion associated locus B family protein [Rhodospirillum sp.]MCF8487945.1 invasion associated locus B family protein [Rhodospirillum sp.]MCF8499292.1 invasion associated locus B family protein [Rhodospirillum sp.]
MKARKTAPTGSARALGALGALTLGALAGFGSVPVAQAQQVNTLGVSGDWTAYTMTENGNTVCYVASQPKKDEGNYTARDEIYALVTHRPAQKQLYVVTIYAGYPYKEGSSVDVSIDNVDYQLFTQGETAWASDDMDKKIVTAMKRGVTMVVKGTSSKGTSTRDTYSLNGITASLSTIDKACGVR